MVGKSAEEKMILDRCEGAKAMFIDGNIPLADLTLSRSLDAFDPKRDRGGSDFLDLDGEVSARSVWAWLAWFAGDTQRAIRQSQLVFEIAEQLDHPFSLAYAYCVGGSALLSVGEFERVAEVSRRATELSDKWQMTYWGAYAEVLRGGSLINSDPRSAIDILGTGKHRYMETGARMIIPWIAWLEARAHIAIGEAFAGLSILRSVREHESRLFRPLIDSLYESHDTRTPFGAGRKF